MKNIVVQMDQTQQVEARTKAAAALAVRFGASVKGVYVAPPAAYAIRAEVGIPESVWENYRNILWEGETHSKTTFERTMDELGVQREWVQPMQSGATGVCHECKFADLVVIGQSANQAAGKVARDLTDQVILNSRKPCLVVPSDYTKELSSGRILIAWNGSDECARVVQSCIPLLQQADDLEILQFAKSRESAADTDALQAYLGQYAIKAKCTLNTDYADVGIQLLDYAKQNNQDIIMLGAYGHPRISEIILGGVTRHVLDNTDRPILMSH